MKIIFSYMSLLTIILSQPSLYFTSYIYRTWIGKLSNAWFFNFTIYARHFNGAILYGIDSEKNQFGLKAIRESNMDRSIRLNYNKISKVINLKTLCGCTSCDDTFVKFQLHLKNTMMNIRCNNKELHSLSITGQNEYGRVEKAINILYPIPMTMKHAKNSIYLMLGNIGPYLSSNNSTIFPLREQMIGCLDYFYLNNTQISFSEEGNMVRRSCSPRCTSDSCNGGICKDAFIVGPYCDCSLTSLNGQHCNDSLKVYIPGANNSFGKMEPSNYISLKISWKPSSPSVYCLLEIVTKIDHVTISVNKNHLMINLTDFPEINENETNFASVTLTNNTLFVTTKTKTSKLNFIMDDNLRIYIGFSNKGSGCGTFNGTYDLYFNYSHLQQIEDTHTRSSTVETNSNKQTNITASTIINATPKAVENFRNIIICFGVSILAIVVIICVTNLLIVLRIRKPPINIDAVVEPAVELTVNEVSIPTNIDSEHYSRIDYNKVYITNDGEDEDIDGYILPEHDYMQPSLPQRGAC